MRRTSNSEVNFSGADTIYYYKINGSLRQALSISITNKTNTTKSATIRVFAPGRETVVTSLMIFPGTKDYRAYAPVVYPNIKSGSHRPVLATVSLTVGTLVKRKKIRIGVHRPWIVYICQDVCTDFTWGLSADTTVKKSIALTDSHLKFMKLTENEVLESQNRWNFNQSMEVKWYIENKSPKEIETLFQRERDGHIQISPLFNSCLTAAMSAEQAIRSLYFVRELEQRWGIDLSAVEHIEVPTITWGMASIFAGAGIKYFVKGWLDYQAPYTRERDNIPLYYWEGPDGQRVLTASDKEASLRANYAQAKFLLNEEYSQVVNELHNWWIPHFESIPNYPYDAFILLGSHGDLSLKTPNQVKILVSNVKRYNEESWEYPKLISANWKQFFHHIEKFTRIHHIPIPVLRGDHGSSWEEWPVHVAAIFAKTRRGVENFITAEKLAALSSHLGANKSYLLNKERLRIAQDRMLQLSEHPWNGRFPQEKTDAVARKNRWQEDLNQKVDSITKQGLTEIARNIPTEDEICLMVFNPLVWKRTDVVTVPGLNEPRVIDKSTKKEVHTQVVLKNGEKFLQFMAEDIPPLGYKVYQVMKERGKKQIRRRIKVNRNVIENRFYRVEVDNVTGGLKSVFDKLHHRELVDPKSPYELNQYVYLSDTIEHTPGSAKITPGGKGPISGELIIEAATLRSNIRTTLILYSDIDRIDIINEVEKIPSSEPTQIHFFFPFNVPRREYHYETTAAIIKPGLVTFGGEQLAGSGQAVNAVRHFVDISNDSYGVTLAQIDSYLVQFGHRTTEESPKVPDVSNSTVLSMIMQNHQPEMVADQGGISRFLFRYAIQGYSKGFNAERAIRLGWEMNNPLLKRTLPSGQEGGLPSANYSFLSCDRPNVIVTALKVAEEGPGRGLILRAWEIKGEATTATFDVSALGVNSARTTDLLERDRGSLRVSQGKVSVSIPGRGFASVRLLKAKSI